MADFVTVTVDVYEAVATVRIDRPPVNALNSQVQDELGAAAAECATRSDVRAVVLWGGEWAFVGGADIKEFQQMSSTDVMARSLALNASFSAIAGILKPVIAAVTGYALGGGCELALTADFRVSADDAKWGQPEILLGIIPGGGATQRLARLIGPAKAKDLIFTGRTIGADEAHEIGLVDVLAPASKVLDVATAMARRFAAGPALALRAAKAAIDGGLSVDLDSGLRLESHLFEGLFATEDCRIGLDSFIANGPGKASFTGR